MSVHVVPVFPLDQSTRSRPAHQRKPRIKSSWVTTCPSSRVGGVVQFQLPARRPDGKGWVGYCVDYLWCPWHSLLAHWYSTVRRLGPSEAARKLSTDLASWDSLWEFMWKSVGNNVDVFSGKQLTIIQQMITANQGSSMYFTSPFCILPPACFRPSQILRSGDQAWLVFYPPLVFDQIVNKRGVKYMELPW